MSKCTGITLLETITAGDVLNVTIDDTTEALWIYNYAEAMKYVGQEVIVDYRRDIYKGVERQFIATIVIPTVVQTLDKKDNIKLYCDQTDNFSNVSFSEIGNLETKPGCIVYCVKSEFKTSNKAIWQELLIRDRSMHTATLRVFDWENAKVDFSGCYVMTSLTRSQYGFQSDFVTKANGTVPPNPEIEIARNFIMNYFLDDAEAQAYLSKYNLLSFMEEAIDYEKGYGLMRLAMELSIVDNMSNMSKDVDNRAIGEALLAKRGWMARNSILSHTVNNVSLASSINWKNKELVLRLLDIESEDSPSEYAVMKNVENTVDSLLQIRKGTVF